MREPERYWTYKGPPIPEVAGLPPGVFKGDEKAWCSLSPGMRRTIWRDAILGEARVRQVPSETVDRLKTMTLGGSFGSLDEYLEAIKRIDARRAPLKEDVERLERADALHQQSETQIAARETL